MKTPMLRFSKIDHNYYSTRVSFMSQLLVYTVKPVYKEQLMPFMSIYPLYTG